jgi:FMN phosphatase YigB (HAD superfamily)
MRYVYKAFLSLSLFFAYFSSASFVLNPENTVIACDFHGVVVELSAKKIIKYLYNRPHKTDLFWFCVKNGYGLINDWINMRRKVGVSDRIFEILAKKYPGLDAFKQDFIALTNMQEINKPVVKALKKLKKQGFKIVLASNIGPEVLSALERDKDSIKIHRALALFDERIVPNEANNFIHKPHKIFFEKVKESSIVRNKDVLFIDDNDGHLRAAQGCGFTAMLPDAFLKMVRENKKKDKQ